MKKTRQKAAPHLPSAARTGFSLVEVLTVIAIIAILMAAGAIGLGNLNAGKGTTSAVATCESLFEEARTIAVSKRCKARVMVYAGDPTKETYLQRVVIVHEDIKPDGTVDEGNWVLASRAFNMPKGVYFSQEFSQLEPSGKIPEFTLVTPKAEYAGKYFYYEFNGEGIFEKPGSSFVIGAGVRPKGQEPKTTTSSKRDFMGFVTWRNGRTSTFRNPSQIPNLPDSSQSFKF